MSLHPDALFYAETHEWARREDDGSVTVGITDHAQQALGDVVYVELPSVGAAVVAGAQTGIVESVKAASDIYAPVYGEIVEVNEFLADEPSKVNDDPMGDAWFFKIKPSDPSQMDEYMTEDAYNKLIG